MIKFIKNWLRIRAQVKAFKKIKKGLEDNPKLMIRAKVNFEKSFGVNSNVRTKEQWNRLAKVYGIDLVCKIENMDIDEVKNKCNESFSDRCKKVLSER